MKKANLIIDQTNSKMFFKFLLNGLVATIVHYILMIFFIKYFSLIAGVSYGIASFFGILCSFIGNKFFVFKNMTSKKNFVLNQFNKFIKVYFSLMITCSIFIALLTDYAQINYNLSFLIVTLFQVIISFYSNQNYVFKNL